MKNKIFVIFCLLLAIGMNSCGNKQTTSGKDKLDTVWNERVQDTFYGLVLGKEASVNKIVTTLESHGFYWNKQYSTDELLHFRSRQSQYFSFGGLSWQMLDVERTNNILSAVRFMNSGLDKAAALSTYKDIKIAMEAKYSPSAIATTDTTIYAETYYLGRNKVYSTISCFRYEAVEKKIMIGTRLVYWTKKGKKTSNDEL